MMGSYVFNKMFPKHSSPGDSSWMRDTGTCKKCLGTGFYQTYDPKTGHMTNHECECKTDASN
jgi:hypothetical protein